MSESEIVELARTVPQAELASLIGTLAEAQAVASQRLLTPAPAAKVQPVDELISTTEAARRLGISKTLLYHKDFPFTVRDPNTRRLRFSTRGIERYINEQTGGR